jgi:hypothetical protein
MPAQVAWHAAFGERNTFAARIDDGRSNLCHLDGDAAKYIQ